MKARILRLDSDAHQLAQALLPWFVNGTLDGPEAQCVEAHLAQCPRCQADAASQGRLQALSLDAEPAGHVDRGWAMLRSRLDAKPAASRTRSAGARGQWTRWLPLVVGVQGVIVLALALALFVPTRQAEPYRALGAAPREANALVVFRADATEAEIRRALRASGARLVGGPTVTDAYLLRVPDPGPEMWARLRAQPAVARAESLDGVGQR